MSFTLVEAAVGTVVEQLIPSARHDDFKEFHAAELYNGGGAFKGIDKRDRHEAIRALLKIIHRFQLPFVYSAVDKAR